MLSLLVSLLILLVIMAVIWWILSMIPIPAPFVWIVRVIFAIIFLIALISLLTGGLSIYPLVSRPPLR
jgi:hypothetical protein